MSGEQDAGATVAKRASEMPKRASPIPKAARRIQLLAVARQIVQTEGIGALTMSALAERSGATKPIVYDHFKNSEDVILCLMEINFQNVSVYLLEKVKHADNIDDFIDISVGSLFDFHKFDSFDFRIITNGFSPSRKVNDLYFEYHHRSVDFYKIILTQQGLDDDIAGVAAYSLCELVLSTVFRFANTPQESVARQQLAQMAKGLIHALMIPGKVKPQPPIDVLKLKSS